MTNPEYDKPGGTLSPMQSRHEMVTNILAVKLVKLLDYRSGLFRTFLTVILS